MGILKACNILFSPYGLIPFMHCIFVGSLWTWLTNPRKMSVGKFYKVTRTQTLYDTDGPLSGGVVYIMSQSTYFIPSHS